MNKIKCNLKESIWCNNPSIAHLLGLCPILSISNNVTNALGLGIATTFVLVLSNATVSVLRQWIPQEIRIPIYVIIISTVVSLIKMLINAYMFNLYQTIGVFIPLIVTNCIVISRIEVFASKCSLALAIIDGFITGLGLTYTLFLIGVIREFLGNGTIFIGAEYLLGQWASILYIKIFHTETHFLLAILPPSAFICLGLILAGKQCIDKHINYDKGNN